MKLIYSFLDSKILKGILQSILFLLPLVVSSQNCTVNANADITICPGGSLLLPPDQFYLLGTSNSLPGSDFIQRPLWTQISGPAVQILTPNTDQTIVKGAIPGNTYTFRLSAQCGDGSTIFDDVVYKISPLTIAKAGDDQTYCEGSYSLNGNTVDPLETGTWSIIGNNNAGITISSPNTPNSSITVSGDSSGFTTLRWSINSGSSSCTSFDEVVISTLGGKMPVNAGTDITLSNCYSSTQSVKLNGSYGGNAPGQQLGTWTVISGPNVPDFANPNTNNTNVNGLVEGTYIFRWTVAGICANGIDQVTVIVPPPTADVTDVVGQRLYFCDGRTSTILKGTTPLYINETVQWTQTGGPTAVIQNPNSPSTTVSGMTTVGLYSFLYTLTNNVTNCVTTAAHTVSLEASMSISGGNDQTLGCNDFSATIPVSSAASGQMSWQLVAGPDVNPLLNPPYPSYPTPLINFTGNSIIVDQLTFSGTYIVRLVKAPRAGSQCETTYDDVAIISSAQPTTSSAGTTQTLACNATYGSLAGNIAVRGKGKWSQVSGPSTVVFSDVSDPTTTVSSLINGKYNFRWTISGGQACEVSQSTSQLIVSSATPTIANAGTDQSICFGTPVKLQGNSTLNSETGTWTVTPSTGIVFSDMNDPNATVTGLAQNTAYIFTWTIANGCGTTSDSVTITTNDTQGANANAGPDQCLQTGTTIAILAGNDPAPGNGEWTQIAGTPGLITNPTQHNTTVTGLSDGDYIFKWSISNVGCTDHEDTVAITIAPTVTSAQAGPDQKICGSTATVIGNSPAAGETGLWVLVSGGDGPIIVNPNNPTTTITGLTSGSWVYKWIISRGACPSSSDNVQLNVDEVPSPAIGGEDQIVCNQNSVTLGATPPTVGNGIWSLKSGPNSPLFSDARSATSKFSGLITGEYVLEWITYTGANCPPNSDQVVIKVTEVAAAGADFSTCLEGPLLLKGNDGSTGTWSYISGGSGSPIITPTSNNSVAVTGLIPGVYVFRYTIPAQGSCPETSDDITVTVNGQIITSPNAGPDQTFCNAGSNEIVLAASPLDVGTTGKWTKLSGPLVGSFLDDTNPNTTFVNPDYGTYVFNWTVSSGTCQESDQVRVENAQPPSQAMVQGNDIICGSVTELSAIPPAFGTGKWAQVSGPTIAIFDSEILPTIKVSNLTQTGGIYVFSWTVSNGTVCTPTTANVTITVTANVTVPEAGPDQTICETGTATLAANTIVEGTGKWLQISGPIGSFFSNTGNPNAVFTPNGSGTYVLQWSATNLSCSFFDEVTINADQLPTTSNAGNPIVLCEFQPLSLAANVPATGTGLWTQISGPSNVLFDAPNTATTAVFGAQAGNYVFRWTISNRSCPSSFSDVSVTINALPPLANAGTDQTICNTTTAVLNGNNPSTGSGIWTFVTNAGNTAVITNPNAYNTTVTNISTGITRLKWTISNASCTPYSDEVNIEKPLDLITSDIITNNTICLGGTVTLSTTPSGSIVPYTYQWQTSADGISGWTNISGQTNSSYSTDSALLVGQYYYRVIVTSSCAQITSNVGQLMIIPDPVITIQPVGNSICSGNTHTMNVLATTTNLDAGTITYQWQSSPNGTSGWANVSGGTGANTTSYTTAALVSNLYFRARVTQSGNGCETFSDPVLVSVTTIVAQPVNPAAICVGGIANINITASLNGGSGTLSYQWQRVTNGIFVNETNSTATTANFISDVLTDTTQFICLVTSSTTNCTVTSNAVTVTVVSDPAITVQPTGGILCSGGIINLSVTATGGTPGLIYQWYSSLDNVSFFPIAGANSNTYTTLALTSDTYYRVDVSASGNGCGLVTSNSVLADVIPDPIINEQPVGNTICSGATHTMSVVASADISGGSLVYQWQRSLNGTTGWVNATGGLGVATPTYTTGALTSNFYYRVRIRQGANGCETFSNAVPVFVTTITVQPLNPTAICVGGVVSIDVTASLNGGAGTLSYQWQSDSGGGYVNQTNATAVTANFTSGILSATTKFRCLIVSSTTNCTITSNEVTATVVPDPTITVQPAGTTVCSGGIHNVAVTAINGTPNLAYQWFNSIDNISFSAIAGATSATYTTPGLVQTTYYRVDVSASGNGCNTITSGVAMVTVLSDIIITTQPAPKTNICSGSTATLNVIVTGGSGNYSYQWKGATSLAGPYTDIAGATFATYTTPNITQNMYYQLTVSDPTKGCEPVTSSFSEVIIPIISGQPLTPSPICIGGTVSISAMASANSGSATFTYQWQSSPDGISSWVNVSGGTGAHTQNYTSGFLSATVYYRAVITSANPSCSLITDIVKATVLPDPVITIQPTGGNICEGGTITMTSGAASGTGNFTYQWQKSLNGTGGWANVMDGSGANTLTYTTGLLNSDIFYRLQVNDSGIGCGIVNSNAAKINVFESPLITTQPTDAEACINQAHTFTVVASGNIPSGTLSYQWQTSSALAGPYSNVINGSGATSTSYTTPTYTSSGNRYFRVLISQLEAGCQSVSNYVTLNVFDIPAAPIGEVSQQPSCTDASGTIAILIPDLGNGFEYSKDGTNFQASTIFSGLAPGNVQIYVRRVGLNTCISPPANFTIFNRLCAVPETFASIPGDIGGDTGTQTILDSDLLNGVILNPADVTVTINSISQYLIFDPATNKISVLPGTPADNYTLTYTICENVNPSNCSTTTEIIRVSKPGIDAVSDILPRILNGAITHLAVINVLTNDSFGSFPATTSNVAISVVQPALPIDPLVSSVPVLNTTTGDVDVPAGTVRGLYVIEYRICEIGNLGNCDSAIIIIPVGAPVIDAKDDVVENINGNQGKINAINALANDSLNGVLIDATNFDKITVKQNSFATPLYPGANVPVFSPTTGSVSIPKGTPADTYYITYTICEKLNSTNCDDASIAIVVDAAPIIANDDVVDNVNSYDGAVNIINVYTNPAGADTFDGQIININLAGLLSASVITPATPKIPGASVPQLFVSSGRVTVPPGTPAGQYQIKYEICEDLNPGNCDDAIVVINVVAPPIIANDDTALNINGYLGATDVLNAYDNDLLNGGALDLSTVTTSIISSPSAINGGAIPVFDATTGFVSIPAQTPAGEYKFVYEICENLNVGNCDQAVITITVISAIIDAVDDTPQTIFNGAVDTANAINALDNDTLDGEPVIPDEVKIDIISPAISINGGMTPFLSSDTGIVSIPIGTSTGTYTIVYRLSEKLNLTNNDTATITIIVQGAIEAINDSATNINGFTGEVNVVNVLANDKLSGVAVVPSQVTISNVIPAISINGGQIPVLDPITGNVNVPAGTAAGTYTIEYRLSENVNLSNFDTATVTIDVIAPVIVANPDTVDSINGYAGLDNAINAITNDRLNGLDMPLQNIDITSLSTKNPVDYVAGNPLPVLNTVTGNVDIPAGTSAGIYIIHYKICEKLNPANCSESDITITVLATLIDADNDFADNINGHTGADDVVNTLTNDELNGVTVLLSQVNIHSLNIIVPSTSTNGIVPILNTVTGFVDVPAGTSSGTYTIQYEICEKLNPTNCSQADIIIIVTAGPVIANDDTVQGINGLDGINDVLNVLANDLVNNSAPTVAQVKINIVSPADAISGGAIPVLNTATGFVSVPAGTSSGVYTIVYEICDAFTTTNCDQAVVKITVAQPSIILIKSGVFSDTNGDGYAQPGELIHYFFKVTNTGTMDLANVVITDPKAVITGNPIAVLKVGDFNTSNYTGTYVLTQADINLGIVTNQALVTAQPSSGKAIMNLSDSDDSTLFGNNDPTVTSVSQVKKIILIKGGKLSGNGGEGSVINYVFTVKNTGNVVLTHIEIADPMLSTSSILVTPATLAPGETGIAKASYTVTAADVVNGQVINSAVVIGDAPDGTAVTATSDSDDPTLPGDDDPTVITLTVIPSIAIVKTATFNDENKNGYAEAGETVTYHFSVTNTGNILLVNVIVKDPKPGVAITGGPITLKPGETDTNTFKGAYVLTKDDIAAGSIENQATVDAVSPDGLIATDKSDGNSILGDNPTVLPLNSCTVIVYNAVSPNGDGKNDLFKIDGIECYTNAYVQIYDRWGVLVYDAYGYDNNTVAFKGISEGRVTIAKQKGLPSGTYFYVITYTTFQNEPISKTGYLYLSVNE